MASVPESLVNRLEPMATETATAAHIAPRSNARERLGTAPPPRTQPLERRLGRSVDQYRNNSQTVSRRNDPPATANSASAAGPSTSAVPAEGVEPGSVLLWNRPGPSHWGQYKTDMSTKLNLNTLTCREGAMRIIGGESPTVSRLYRIPGVDWLLAEQEQFSSTTTLRHADMNGLPQDNTFGPLNTRSPTDVHQRARELTPPARKGKFQTSIKRFSKFQQASKFQQVSASFSKQVSASLITSIKRCTGSLLNHPVRRPANIQETTPERPRWMEMTGDTEN